MTEYEEANLKEYIGHLEACRAIEQQRTAIMQASFATMAQTLADGPKPSPERPEKRRAWYALNAMNSILASTPTEDGNNWPEPVNIAANAVRYADALIAKLGDDA